MLVCIFLPQYLHQNFLLIPLSACVLHTELETCWHGQVTNALTTTRIFRIQIQWPESVAAGHRCVAQPSGPSWYPALWNPFATKTIDHIFGPGQDYSDNLQYPTCQTF